MSPRRTRRGTIRESVSEISINTSSTANKSVRSTRRTNKSYITKGSEEDSDSPADVKTSKVNTTISTILNDTSKSTKSRKRKGQEVENDISMSVKNNETKTPSKTRNQRSTITSKTKKQTKGKKTEQVKRNSFISEDESFDNKRQGFNTSNNLISEDEENSQKRMKSSNENTILIKEDVKTTQTSSKQKVSLSNIDSIQIVTPKTSPLNVSFTPHRSNKTPKKSPSNIGSPKTHTRNARKLLNVPRKLTIMDSPTSSEKSSSSLQLINIENESLVNTSKTRKNVKSVQKSSTSKKKVKSPTLNIKQRLSRSPKIILTATNVKPNKKSPLKQNITSIAENSTSIAENTPEIIAVLAPQENSPERVSEFNPPIISVSPAKPKSPFQSKKSTKTKQDSLKTEKLSKSVSKTEKLSKSVSKFSKSLEINSSQDSMKLSKTDSHNDSNKSKKTSKKKVLGSKKSLSSSKSKKLMNATLPFISGKMPKIVLQLKSKNSFLRLTKSLSPSKSKKSPKQLKGSSKKSKNVKDESLSKSKKSSNDNSLSKSKKLLEDEYLSQSTIPSTNVSPPKSKKLSKDLSLSKLNKSLKSVSPSKSKKSTSISQSKIEKVLIKTPTKKSIISPSMSPMVVVNKLSAPELQKSASKVKNIEPRINLVPVDCAIKSPVMSKAKKSPVNKGSKSPKSTKNRISLNPRLSIVKSQKNTPQTSRVHDSNNKNYTPPDVLEKKLKNLRPANTSTPRERMKRTLNVISTKIRSPAKKVNILKESPISKSKIIKCLNDNSKNDSNLPMLEDESEPSLNDSSLIRMSDVFDIDASQKNNTLEVAKNTSSSEKSPKLNSPKKSRKSDTFEINKSSSNNSAMDKSKKNDTYEVDFPKTPSLQKKSLKRTIDQAELSGNDGREMKKVCKVRFAPDSNNSVRSSNINRVGTPGHTIHQKKTPLSINKNAIPNKSEKQMLNSVPTSQTKASANTPTIKRRSNSMTESMKKSLSNREAQIASINRLSRPRIVTDSAKKIEAKTPTTTTKKLPNFAEIHQKNFSKMESIIDLKKRVEKRHVVLKNAVTPNTQKLANPTTRQTESKLIPTDSTNGTYNRFGYKLRKNEAVDIMTKKQSGKVDSREKKREDARAALKGVRTNRRFELIMKARAKAS